jgi:hypothetical protein
MTGENSGFQPKSETKIESGRMFRGVEKWECKGSLDETDMNTGDPDQGARSFYLDM